jgi:hypothetical protein
MRLDRRADAILMPRLRKAFYVGSNSLKRRIYMDKFLTDYKRELLTLLEKSSDNFEKQLNYISAGAIGVSMIVVEKVVKDLSNSYCKILLTFAWVFFTLTLLSNLVSHIYTFSVHSKTIDEINSEQYDYTLAKRRNDSVKVWNIISAVLLILGIFLLIIYVSLNL